MFNIEANLNLYGLAGTASVVNAIVNLDELTTVDTFKAPITLLTGTAQVLYAAPGSGVALVKSVVFVNTSSTQVGLIKLFKGASAVDATQISGAITVPARGTAIYTGEFVQVLDGTGAVVSTSATTVAKNYSARVYARINWR